MLSCIAASSVILISHVVHKSKILEPVAIARLSVSDSMRGNGMRSTPTLTMLTTAFVAGNESKDFKVRIDLNRVPSSRPKAFGFEIRFSKILSNFRAALFRTWSASNKQALRA